MTLDQSKATDAMKSIITVLKRDSKMEIDNSAGIRQEKINGVLEVNNVSFAYPSRPKQILFSSLNLKVEAGTAIACVGQGGSGQSTIVGLIERFSNPLHGWVELIDVIDLL